MFTGLEQRHSYVEDDVVWTHVDANQMLCDQKAGSTSNTSTKCRGKSRNYNGLYMTLVKCCTDG